MTRAAALVSAGAAQHSNCPTRPGAQMSGGAGSASVGFVA